MTDPFSIKVGEVSCDGDHTAPALSGMVTFPFDLAEPPLESDHTVEDFPTLTKLMLRFRHDPGYWIFRGDHETGERTKQRNLTPFIGRKDTRRNRTTGDPEPYDPKQERLLYEYFKRAAPPYLNHRPTSDLEWLAIAQHHGCATRLLDWTESLFIAAFFAVAHRKPGEHEEPVIYATKNITPTSDETPRKLEDLPEENMLYHPPHLTRRITAQRSVFTVRKSPSVPFNPTPLVTITLKGNAFGYKMDLNAAGINESILFPEIDGLAHQSYWLYKWSSLPPGPL